MSRSRNPWVLLGPIFVLVVLGVVSAGYVLVKQRFPVPFRDVYEVRAILPAADGVAPGFGQAVSVSGVKVGTISKASIEGETADVTFEIDRTKLPAVYRDARADLRPITPLSDMLVELDPGHAKRGRMADDGVIPLSRTSSPVPLSDLLSTLDADTRGFLEQLLTGLGQGTKDRAPDFRALLRSLGPTADQVRRITTALDGRRRELARLVTNLADVTDAARSDGRLGEVVVTGNRTLEAIAQEETSLRRSLADLPRTVSTAQQALSSAGRLSDELGPAARELVPPVRELPTTLRALKPLTDDFTTAVRGQIRPLVREAQPAVRDLQPTLRNLSAALPDVSRIVQAATYLTNELAYNPPGRDEGMLYWIAWAFHNFGSATSTADAHGALFRAIVMVNCHQMTTLVDLGPLFKALTGSAQLCPAT